MIKKVFEFVINFLYVIVTRYLSNQAARVGKLLVAISLISMVLFNVFWFWPLLVVTVFAGLLGVALIYVAKVISSRR